MPDLEATSQVVVLSPDALLDESGELMLNRATDLAITHQPEGKALVIFTDLDAAEKYRDAEQPRYRMIGLGLMEFLCVLARMGLYCPNVLVDPKPSGGLTQIEPLERMRQRLSRQLQEALNRAGQ